MYIKFNDPILHCFLEPKCNKGVVTNCGGGGGGGGGAGYKTGGRRAYEVLPLPKRGWGADKVLACMLKGGGGGGHTKFWGSFFTR